MGPPIQRGRFRVLKLQGLRVWGSRFRGFRGLGLRVWGSKFSVSRFEGFRVQGLGSRVLGPSGVGAT